MDTTEQVAATLTPEQLDAIVALAPTEPIDAIVLTWRSICPEWDLLTAKQLRPWSYSLPRTQWSAIGEALARFRSPLSGANALMDWCNVGPSCREDDQ